MTILTRLKRLISILLIFLVLLNTMGYYFIFYGLEIRNDVRMSGVLDADAYDESKAITLEIPMVLPYQYDNPHFVRVEGKFEHKGETYRLIKQKYEGDTLTVICIRDEQDKQIQNALTEFVNTFTDTPDTDAPTGKNVSVFIKEYLMEGIAVGLADAGWTQEVGFTKIAPITAQEFICAVTHPPEA